MGRLTRFLRRLGFKASQAFQSILWPYGPGQAVWTPRNYEDLAKEGYASNAIVFAVVSLIADAFAVVPVKLYRRASNGDVEEVENHRMLEVLARPNPMQSEADFRMAWASYLLLSGNAYVHGPGPETGPNAGRPLELWPLRPDKMKIVAGTWMEPIAGFRYEEGEPVTFPAAAVMHTKLFNPLNAWYGMSPIEAASRGIDQHNAANTWNVAQLQNGGAPPFVVAVKGTMDEPAQELLRQQIKERVTNTTNARKPIIMSGADGYEVKMLGYSPLDMDWIGGKKMSALEICGAFKVPPQMIGIPDAQTYANYEQAEKSFYTQATLPITGRYCDSLTRWLVPKYEPTRANEFFFWYDKSEIDALQEDQKQLAERAKILFDACIATQKQAAEIAGIPTDLAEDVFKMSLGSMLVPAGEVVNFDTDEQMEEAARLLDAELKQLLGYRPRYVTEVHRNGTSG